MTALLLTPVLLILACIALRRINEAEAARVGAMTDEELDEEIQWSLSYGESECIYYDERARRDAVKAMLGRAQ